MDPRDLHNVLDAVLDGGIDGLVHLSDISWDLPGEEGDLCRERAGYGTDHG